MKSVNVPRNGLALVALLALAGCTSPPSVAPLLSVAERAMVAEAEHLRGDAQREQQYLEQMRHALAAAYRRDLMEQAALSPEWVEEATTGYVAAREALLRHEAALDAARRQRGANLADAALAIQRAAAILEQQDALIVQTVRVDLWRLLNANVNPPQETQP